MRDQATIRVEDKEKDGNGNGSGNGNGGGNGDGTGIGSGNNDGSTMAASTSPKTGDTSHKELFQGTDSAFVSFFRCSRQKNVWRQCSQMTREWKL